MEGIGRAGPNAGKTADTAILLNHHRSFCMFTPDWIHSQRKQRLKWAVIDAKVAPSAVFLDNGDHGLPHGEDLLRRDLMMCLFKGQLQTGKIGEVLRGLILARYRGDDGGGRTTTRTPKRHAQATGFPAAGV